MFFCFTWIQGVIELNVKIWTILCCERKAAGLFILALRLKLDRKSSLNVVKIFYWLLHNDSQKCFDFTLGLLGQVVIEAFHFTETYLQFVSLTGQLISLHVPVGFVLNH